MAFGDIGAAAGAAESSATRAHFHAELDLRLAHRHLDLVLAALEAHPESTTATLSGPALTLAELQSLGADPPHAAPTGST